MFLHDIIIVLTYVLLQHTTSVLMWLCIVITILSILGFIWPVKIDFALQGFTITDHSVAENYNTMDAAIQARELELEHERSIITRRRLLSEDSQSTEEVPQGRQLLQENAWNSVILPPILVLLVRVK